MAKEKKKQRVKIRFIGTSLELYNEEGKPTVVKPHEITGSYADWKVWLNEIEVICRFEIGESGYTYVLKRTEGSPWMPPTLYAQLMALTTMMTQAVFRGYKKKSKKDSDKKPDKRRRGVVSEQLSLF